MFPWFFRHIKEELELLSTQVYIFELEKPKKSVIDYYVIPRWPFYKSNFFTDGSLMACMFLIQDMAETLCDSDDEDEDEDSEEADEATPKKVIRLDPFF